MRTYQSLVSHGKSTSHVAKTCRRNGSQVGTSRYPTRHGTKGGSSSCLLTPIGRKPRALCSTSTRQTTSPGCVSSWKSIEPRSLHHADTPALLHLADLP